MLDERGFRHLLRRTTGTFLVALLVPMLVLIGLVGFLRYSNNRLSRSDRVIAASNQMEKILVTMSGSFRDLALANNEGLRTLYLNSRAQLDQPLRVLAEAVSDDPGQTALRNRMEQEARRWVAAADATLVQLRAGRSSDSQRPTMLAVRSSYSSALSDAQTLIEEEERLRASRNRTMTAVVTVLMAAFVFAAGMEVPLLFWWLRRLLGKISGYYQAGVNAAERRAAELHVTLSSIGDAVIATDAQGRVQFLNPAAEALMGWTSDEAAGRELPEVFAIFNERTRAPAVNPVQRVLDEDVVVGLANHTILRARSGREYPIEDSAAPIRDESGNVRGVILVFHDVTEKRVAERTLMESERRLRFLNDLSEATRPLVEPDQIIAVATRLLGQHLATSRCAYADVEPDQDQCVVAHDFVQGCESVAGPHQLSAFSPGLWEKLRAGQVSVIGDSDKEVEPVYAANYRAISLRASVCYPLVKENTLRAFMSLHQTEPRAWTDGEVALLGEVAERCWATVDRARAQADVRERARLSSLRADLSDQFDSGKPLTVTLQGCSELLVRHLDAAFARIWVLDRADNVLVLRASAGLYTRIDGAHARVPIGTFTSGRIAESRRPHFTNHVGEDPYIRDREWARREGMVAFAGFPLLFEGQLLGVMAMFSRRPFSPTVLADLDPVARAISQHIDRKGAEAALRQARDQSESDARAVAESGQRFRLLSEMVALQVWTATLNGHLDFANQECAQYFGVDVEREILGTRWAQFVHPDDQPAAFAAWQSSLASGERYEAEFRLRNKEGVYRWFLARARAMRDLDGRIVKWFGTNTDIDELKSAQGAAERASSAKDEFLAALSHELRTPLAPVLMAAAGLLEDKGLTAETREQLSMMERNISLEARLIDDLLDLTAISRGKLQVRTQTCDAHALIALAIEIVRGEAVAKDIVIEHTFNATNHGLNADPARFQQVIWNLLRNSVKFTPRGGRIAVRTADVPAPDGAPWLRIEVMDTGIGIAPNLLDEIFLPFDQGGLTGDHRFGGIGLGLAIARAVVDLHGGRITAHSAGPNHGATFLVELPSAPLPAKAPGAEAAPAAPGVGLPAAAPVKPMRLLLVDDHDSTLQALLRLLKRDGHTVTAASSVAEARAAAAAGKFDLLISDLGLPDGSGMELMEHLRADYGLPGIALSGYGMEEGPRALEGRRLCCPPRQARAHRGPAGGLGADHPSVVAAPLEFNFLGPAGGSLDKR